MLIFKKELNVLERLQKNIPLTNNFSEAKNRSLNSYFDNVKPSTSQFMKKLRELDNLNLHYIQSHIRSMVLSNECSNYIDNGIVDANSSHNN